jgi:nucleoid-associated protein YgaU
MKQKVVLVIITIVGLGVGLAAGIIITNTKSKAAIADMQAKMLQSEASSQERIRNYDATVNQLTGELQLAKFEIQTLKNPAPAAEPAVTATAGNEQITTEPADGPIPGDAKLYTIKSGDSLWSIAQNQLGDGNRFKEILKLNPKISAKSNLTIGTKLKIPAK